jgi:hypothetical protein
MIRRPGTPIVVDGVVFVSLPFSGVAALDATAGQRRRAPLGRMLGRIYSLRYSWLLEGEADPCRRVRTDMRETLPSSA